MADQPAATAGPAPFVAKDRSLERRLYTLAGFLLIGAVLGWVLFAPRYTPNEAMESAQVAVILALLVPASALIERTLETILDLIQTRARKAVAFLARTEAWINDAEREAGNARNRLIRATAALDEQLAGAVDAQAADTERQVTAGLEAFERRVNRAEMLLASVMVESPDCGQAKRIASLHLACLWG